MNYIKKLQEEVKEKDDKIKELEDMIHDLKIYLDLPKFKGECENYVNINDVLLRLRG